MIDYRHGEIPVVAAESELQTDGSCSRSETTAKTTVELPAGLYMVLTSLENSLQLTSKNHEHDTSAGSVAEAFGLLKLTVVRADNTPATFWLRAISSERGEHEAYSEESFSFEPFVLEEQGPITLEAKAVALCGYASVSGPVTFIRIGDAPSPSPS